MFRVFVDDQEVSARVICTGTCCVQMSLSSLLDGRPPNTFYSLKLDDGGSPHALLDHLLQLVSARLRSTISSLAIIHAGRACVRTLQVCLVVTRVCALFSGQAAFRLREVTARHDQAEKKVCLLQSAACNSPDVSALEQRMESENKSSAMQHQHQVDMKCACGLFRCN